MTASISYDANGNARSFNGREAVNVFAMATIASALRLYAKTGMKAARNYTPANMMAAASQHTGKTFKKRDYLGAADALMHKVQEEKARLELLNTPQAPGTPVTHLRTGHEGLVIEDKGARILVDFGSKTNPFEVIPREELRLS